SFGQAAPPATFSPAAPAPTAGAPNDFAVSRPNPTVAPPRSVFPGMQPTAPPDPARYAHEDLDFTRRGAWTSEKETVVRGPFDYLYDHPGKDFRTSLINSFDAWLEVPPASLEIITRVVGMLHTASLLVDDVEDSSSL